MALAKECPDDNAVPPRGAPMHFIKARIPVMSHGTFKVCMCILSHPCFSDLGCSYSLINFRETPLLGGMLSYDGYFLERNHCSCLG